MAEKTKKHILKLFARIAKLFFLRPSDSGRLVEQSYNNISKGYDAAWTNHMRSLTEQLINRLELPIGAKALDLTCGTGFATNLISQKVQTKVTGVDKSQGMIEQAKLNYGSACEFICSDALEYLRTLPADSLDIIVCCWGLGYLKPMAILRESKRLLKPGGKIAIIDNSLFSLKEILYCSFLTFTEQPEKLANLMRFRFLSGKWHLKLLFGLNRLKSIHLSTGIKTYYVPSGQAAIERLTETGAAAGFEYAAKPEDKEQIYKRFAEILEKKYLKTEGIPIIHRYFSGIAQK